MSTCVWQSGELGAEVLTRLLRDLAVSQSLLGGLPVTEVLSCARFILVPVASHFTTDLLRIGKQSGHLRPVSTHRWPYFDIRHRVPKVWSSKSGSLQPGGGAYRVL